MPRIKRCDPGDCDGSFLSLRRKNRVRLSHKYGHEPVEFTPEKVRDIHQMGGTVLGSSRGPREVSDMVDTLERMGIGILFAIGGDGTLRGGHAIFEEITRRRLKISVIGVPKTIDNDISFTDMSFGFVTAVSEAREAIYSAHTEAQGARNGIGQVKLMGRESGFIAAFASLSNGDVNFCLIPEMRFSMESFLRALKERLDNRRHAVIVVGEGAGQDLIESTGGRDESGSIRFADIGLFLKEQIQSYFKKIGMDVTLKYIDPSYTIRSMPANPYDSPIPLDIYFLRRLYKKNVEFRPAALRVRRESIRSSYIIHQGVSSDW